MNEYNIYNINVDDTDETGVFTVSLVKDPAVEKKYLLFNKENKFIFSIDSIEKRLVHGVVMLADTAIMRQSTELGLYYVNFSKDAILKIVEKYSKNNYNSSVNLNHDGTNIEGVYMIESYILDKKRNISVNFKDVTEGSWIGTFKVENDQIWEDIKKGEWSGFSIEGLFNLDEVVGTTTKKQNLIEDFNNEKDMLELLTILKNNKI